MMRFTTLLLALLLGRSVVSVERPLQDGDIIFQRSQSHQSHAISAATGSEFTHVGIIFVEAGSPFVYEAVQPVQRTPFKEWVARGKDGRYVVRRLRDTSSLDTQKLRATVRAFLGRDYDWRFDWSDSQIYCSELVWKAYDRSMGIQIGALRQLKDFDLEHETVRRLMAERYGQDIPYTMSVISPRDIFSSDLLETVREK